MRHEARGLEASHEGLEDGVDVASHSRTLFAISSRTARTSSTIGINHGRKAWRSVSAAANAWSGDHTGYCQPRVALGIRQIQYEATRSVRSHASALALISGACRSAGRRSQGEPTILGPRRDVRGTARDEPSRGRLALDMARRLRFTSASCPTRFDCRHARQGPVAGRAEAAGQASHPRSPAGVPLGQPARWLCSTRSTARIRSARSFCGSRPGSKGTRPLPYVPGT